MSFPFQCVEALSLDSLSKRKNNNLMTVHTLWKSENDKLIEKNAAWIFENLLWVDLFFKQARVIASKSKDPRKIGAVIATENHRIISQGFNGFPQGIKDDFKDIFDKETNFAKVVHAEVNALLFAEGKAKGNTLYVCPHPPCARCAVQIIQAGIKRVVFPEATDANPRWIYSYMESFKMFKEAGIEVVPIRDLDKMLEAKFKETAPKMEEYVSVGREILSIPSLSPAKVNAFLEKQEEGETKDFFTHLLTVKKGDVQFKSFIHAVEEFVIECERRMGKRQLRVTEWIDPSLAPLPEPVLEPTYEKLESLHIGVDGKCVH